MLLTTSPVIQAYASVVLAHPSVIPAHRSAIPAHPSVIPAESLPRTRSGSGIHRPAARSALRTGCPEGS